MFVFDMRMRTKVREVGGVVGGGGGSKRLNEQLKPKGYGDHMGLSQE